MAAQRDVRLIQASSLVSLLKQWGLPLDATIKCSPPWGRSPVQLSSAPGAIATVRGVQKLFLGIQEQVSPRLQPGQQGNGEQSSSPRAEGGSLSCPNCGHLKPALGREESTRWGGKVSVLSQSASWILATHTNWERAGVVLALRARRGEMATG